MAGNQWDHSNILLSNRSGANMAQGIQQAGRAFGKGIEAYYEKKAQREKEENTVDWLNENEGVVNQLFPQLAEVKDPAERRKVIKAGIKGAGLENLVQVQAFAENQKRAASSQNQLSELRALQIEQEKQRQAEINRQMEERARINAKADQTIRNSRTTGIIKPEAQAEMLAFANSPLGQLRQQGVTLTPEMMMSGQTTQEPYQPQSPTGKVLADLSAARAAGDMESVKNLQADLAQRNAPSGTSFEIGPDGGVKYFQGKNNLTTGSTTKSHERQVGFERVLKEGASLLGKLRPEDLGFAGVIQEDLINKGLAQIAPGLADETVSANRTRLRQFREGSLKQISADSRFSNVDRKAIERLLPQDGVFESYPSARAKLYAAIELMSRRASTEAERRGEKSLAELSPEELLAKGRDGTVPKEQAAALLNALHPDFVSSRARKK